MEVVVEQRKGMQEGGGWCDANKSEFDNVQTPQGGYRHVQKKKRAKK